MNCIKCNKETNNPKFCSRSCSASYTNTQNPKRKPSHSCKTCGIAVNSKKWYCSDICKAQGKLPPYQDIKLEDAIYNKHHRSSAFALVRSRARVEAKKLGFNKCLSCGYSKHIEICHIKPINSFSLDTMLSIINHSKNILPLCPNCHWEFDKGILKSEQFLVR